jgi:hypothetical protein
MLDVKIKSCHDDGYWYAKQIGNIFQVRPSEGLINYYLYSPSYLEDFYILKKDCEVVHEEKNNID